MRPSPLLRHAWALWLMLGLSACAALLSSLFARSSDEPAPDEALTQP